MAKEKCRECKSTLVLDEENLCAYCELKLGENERSTPNVDCGICKVIVEEDSEGLFCDVCMSWFHNECNETPLHYDLYALLNEAPNNVKWFCDRCIWETEKWITQVNNKQKESLGVRKVKTILNKLNNEVGKESGLNVVINDQLNCEGKNEVNVDNTEKHGDNHNCNIPEIKLEIDHEEHEEYMEFEDTHNSVESDEWSPNEEKEEVAKVTPKKKRKNKTNLRKYGANTKEISEEVVTENMSKNLDISPENLSNIIVEIRTIQNGKSKRLKCNLCSKGFLHFEDCIAHKLKVHNGVQKPYKCQVCEMTFEQKKKRRRHMEKHDATKKFECNLCSKKMKNYDCLRSHLKIFHMEGNHHSCTECDHTSKYKINVIKHMIKEHAFETKHKCEICSNYFHSKERLNFHLNIHNSDRNVPCEVCNKTFKNIYLMKMHSKRQHASEKIFKCTECEKEFTKEAMLKKHMLKHLSNEEREHACDECDVRFNFISHLKRHKEMHAGVSNIICDICGKVLQDRYYLKRHMMIHNDERPLKCEICGKGFRHYGQLDLHIKYHKKIVTASCPICGFGAPTKSVLNTHMKLVHTTETPFACDACGNSYKTKGNLSKHKRGIRGSCKGFNSSDSTIKDKREPNTFDKPYYEDNESKQEDSAISFPENYSSTAFVPTMQSHDNHPPLLLYTNSHNSNVNLSQFHNSLIPPNSRGITATIQDSTISY